MPFKDRGLVFPGAIVAEGEVSLRRIGHARSGQLEVEPVLAVKAGGGAVNSFGLPALHPRQLGRSHAGVEAGAGASVVVAVRVGSQIVRHQAGRARIEPEQAAADRFARGVDEPRSVALGRHAESRNAARRSGTRSTSSRKVAAQSAQVRPMSCST